MTGEGLEKGRGQKPLIHLNSFGQLLVLGFGFYDILQSFNVER